MADKPKPPFPDTADLPIEISEGLAERMRAALEEELTLEDRLLLCFHDGALTAAAIGPVAIADERLLALVCPPPPPGEGDPEIEELARRSILMRRDTTAEEIRRAGEEYATAISELLAEDDELIALGQAWAEGFLETMQLAFEAWEPLVLSDGSAELAQIFMLIDKPDGTPMIPPEDLEGDFELEELRKEAVLEIPAALVAIEAFWRERRQHTSLRPTNDVQPVGRNDPCPCGSGKRHKKCCGAA
jgi:uncharacterized protein